MCQAQELSLRKAPLVGETARYKMKAELEFIGIGASAGSGTVTAVATEKITKIEADGTYMVESSTSAVAADVDGTPIKGADQPPMTTVFRANGDILSVRGEKIGSAEYRIANLNAFRPPDKPVKAGDSWSRDIAADPKTGMVAAKASFTFEAMEKVGEINAAKIKYTYAEAMEKDAATVEGYFWIREDGSMLKCELKVKNMPMPSSAVKVNAKITVAKE